MQNIIYKTLLAVGLVLSAVACGGNNLDLEDVSLERLQSPDYEVDMLWEPVRADGQDWTNYLIPIIENELASSFMPGSDDMASFCPKYSKFSNTMRAQFWAYLISAMVKFESGFDPTARMAEPSLGTDKTTGTTVYSEGLLQLSYQDSGWIPTCAIDWNKDKGLAARDPRKTILNPYINLNCGVRILAKQIENRRRIAVSSGVYWAVLRPGHPKLPQIQKLTKDMPGCM